MQNIEIPAPLSKTAARCRLYSYFSAMFRYPEPGLNERLCQKEYWDILRHSALDASKEGLSLPSKLEEVIRCVLEHNVDWAAEHVRVFGASPRGRISLYECEYGTKEIFQLTNEMSDISAFYNAFGLQRSDACQERPDHIAMQLEFMAFLCAKEVVAREPGASTWHLEAVGDAQCSFLRDHLGRWGIAVARQLSLSEDVGVMNAVGAALEAFLVEENKAFNLPVGLAFIPLRNTAPADDPSHCMSCDLAHKPMETPE